MGIAELLRDSQSPAPVFSSEDAGRTALDHFGVVGECRQLAGERDLNFRLTAPDGSRYLLKIWNHGRDRSLIDFQTTLLDHLATQAPEIPTPRLVRDRRGRAWAAVSSPSGPEHAACLLAWLDGVFLRDATLSNKRLGDLGGALAGLDRALSSFNHPAAHRNLLWDVSQAHRLRELQSVVADAATARWVEIMLDRFEGAVLPVLDTLPLQVIHADFNLDNVLVHPESGQVCGIIDFGDALLAPRVCDLAIASAYHLSASGDPVQKILPLVSGYHRVLPLSKAEIAVLPGLIGARLVSSVLITSHMARLHPENREYLLIDTRSAAARLGRLLDEAPESLASRLAACCHAG